jgi:hypothetical protein
MIEREPRIIIKIQTDQPLEMKSTFDLSESSTRDGWKIEF